MIYCKINKNAIHLKREMLRTHFGLRGESVRQKWERAREKGFLCSLGDRWWTDLSSAIPPCGLSSQGMASKPRRIAQGKAGCASCLCVHSHGEPLVWERYCHVGIHEITEQLAFLWNCLSSRADSASLSSFIHQFLSPERGKISPDEFQQKSKGERSRERENN